MFSVCLKLKTMIWILSLVWLGMVNAQDPTTTASAESSVPTTATPVSTKAITQAPIPTTQAPVSTTTILKTTTLSTDESKPFDINEVLNDILKKYEPDCNGNAELTSKLEEVRLAIKLGKEYAAHKIEVIKKFEAYNTLRMFLENSITARINVLNDLLPKITPYSKCSRFYLSQKEKLKEIGKLSNNEKQVKLIENTGLCPYRNEDDDYYYDYYFYNDK